MSFSIFLLTFSQFGKDQIPEEGTEQVFLKAKKSEEILNFDGKNFEIFSSKNILAEILFTIQISYEIILLQALTGFWL